MLAVQRSFDRAAESYRQAAGVQEEIANNLAEMIDLDHCQTALEVGCGDGLFTEKLVERVAIDTLVSLDLAHNFLRRLPATTGALPVQADAEQLPIKANSIDLLTSSSCLQWFTQPERSLPALLNCLRPGGSFYFSVFCRGTFCEMEQISGSSGFGQVKKLPEAEDLLDILNRTSATNVTMKTEKLRRYYPDVMTFLRNQKETGAGQTETKKVAGKNSLQRFIKAYEDHFLTGDGIRVSYNLAYFHGTCR